MSPLKSQVLYISTSTSTQFVAPLEGQHLADSYLETDNVLESQLSLNS